MCRKLFFRKGLIHRLHLAKNDSITFWCKFFSRIVEVFLRQFLHLSDSTFNTDCVKIMLITSGSCMLTTICVTTFTIENKRIYYFVNNTFKDKMFSKYFCFQLKILQYAAQFMLIRTQYVDRTVYIFVNNFISIVMEPSTCSLNVLDLIIAMINLESL